MSSDYKMIGEDGREYAGTLEELRAWASDGRLGPETYVWSAGETRWRRAAERHELRWDLPRPEPPPPVIEEVPAAGFIPRLAAYVFDLMLVNMLFMLVLLPYRERLGEMAERVRQQYDPGLQGQPDIALVLKFQLLLLAVYAPISLIYWVGFNGRFGATPGKTMVGLRIVRADGSPLGYSGAFRRYCAELVSALPFFLGYFMVAFSPGNLALHDVIAGTRVVFQRRG